MFAVEFCKSFREASSEGFFISNAILEPSSLNRLEAHTLYYELEDLLIANNQQNNQLLKHSENTIGGDESREKLMIKLALTTTSIYLLMSRIAFVFGKPKNDHIFETRDQLQKALPHIELATTYLKNEHALFNKEHHEDYYNSINVSSSLYAQTYPF